MLNSYAVETTRKHNNEKQRRKRLNELDKQLQQDCKKVHLNTDGSLKFKKVYLVFQKWSGGLYAFYLRHEDNFYDKNLDNDIDASHFLEPFLQHHQQFIGKNPNDPQLNLCTHFHKKFNCKILSGINLRHDASRKAVVVCASHTDMKQRDFMWLVLEGYKQIMVEKIEERQRMDKHMADKMFDILDDSLMDKYQAMDELYCDTSVGSVIERYMLAGYINASLEPRWDDKLGRCYPEYQKPFFSPKEDGTYSDYAKQFGYKDKQKEKSKDDNSK